MITNNQTHGPRKMMKHGWQLTTWGEIAELEYGRALRGYQESNGTICVYGTNGPIGWTDTAMCSSEGVIVGRKGAYRGVHYSRKPFSVIDTAYFLKARNSFSMRWAYYALLHQDINSLDSGSAIPSTSRTDFYALPVLLPPLPEQRAIAAILGALDDKIELNRRMNATLEAMARALFKSWFVDFDPVRAKMAGRAPAGMDTATAALFPAALQESELGPIPAGWRVATVGEVVECVGGSTPSTKEEKYWHPAIHAWATPKDLSRLESSVLLGTERRISDAGLEKISSGLLPAGTVLMSSRAPVGYLAIAHCPVAINQGFIAMLPNTRVSAPFLLNWCRANMGEIEGRATGTTFPEISKASFRAIKMVAPAEDVVNAFTASVSTFYSRIASNCRESAALTTMRDALLPRLLSGELDVAGVG
jgi:type I restriction enzyme S subunit